MSEVAFCEFPDGRRIAYALSEGKGPCVIFLGGYRSDMTGSKATALEAFCRSKGQRFLRMDYTGHGQSSGDFRDGCIGAWKRDVLDMIERFGGDGDIILIGSSMGAWLALLAARERKDIKALVGVASAPDFTERLIWASMTDAQKAEMETNGEFLVPNCYGGEPYPITKKLIEEARNHLLLSDAIDIRVPVRLMHGIKDDDVPWKMSVTLTERLASNNVQLTLVKDGDHRLSEPAQLDALCRTVAALIS